MGFVDLHVHSNMSDGSLSPAELVRYACEKGLTAFALTDHDTVAGINAAITQAASYPVKVIPGVEVTSILGKVTLHILGYYVDHEDLRFIRELSRISRFQDERNVKICSQLRSYGIEIDYEELRRSVGSRTITREHFANYLVAKGYVPDRAQAFEQYLGKGRPCFMPQEKIPAYDAVKMILRAGGIPVLAHPKMYRLNESEYLQLFTVLKSFGVKGIEAIYPTHTHEEELYFTNTARTLGMLITGGSDFHGALRPEVDMGTGRGNLMISEDILKNLKAGR